MQFTTLLDPLGQGGGALEPTEDRRSPQPKTRLSAPTVLAGIAPAQLHGVTAATTPRDDLLPSGTLPCQENDAELWFAESAAQVEQAKTLCQQCPFQVTCLTGALERGEPWGVWGGQILIDGAIVARKRGRGRPRKSELASSAA